ncbi:cation diffusion facilitator family transporter [Marinimicrobium alkaliphilum]|uniref:cation diffusion facilitator family transporter n=1 Tax=Marinimicrobium alkaliphilum TaxID=2202654 RepID=UPI000DBA5BE0|nr:cation diffusion facilitator family transporter [Marinimicrobium alkaliphilum]
MHRRLSITPQQALRLSLAAAFATMGLKALAWYLTGSVGYLSDALESLVNVAGAGFALAMVSYARRPADRGHPFGHGKAEYFSSAFEGALIAMAAGMIIWVAVERWLNPRELEQLGGGTLIIIVASGINAGVAWLLFRVAKAHHSPAVEADARHLLTDVWTSAGVIVGVLLAGWSGLYWLDPLVAIAVALHILYHGWHLLAKSTGGLMDHALDGEDIAAIEAVFARYSERGCRFVRLRTRAAGARKFAQVAVQVPGDWSVEEGHALADAVEQALRAQGYYLVTHLEPLGAHES